MGIWKEEFVLDARESVNKTSFGENNGVKTVRGCAEEEFGSGIVKEDESLVSLA